MKKLTRFVVFQGDAEICLLLDREQLTVGGFLFPGGKRIQKETKFNFHVLSNIEPLEVQHILESKELQDNTIAMFETIEEFFEWLGKSNFGNLL